MLASPPSTTTLPMMAPATKKELEDKMQQVGSELQKIELELQKCVEVRQRLDSQMNENDQVKKVRQWGSKGSKRHSRGVD